jgi:cell division protein FtsL
MYIDTQQTFGEKRMLIKRLLLSNTFRVCLSVFILVFGVLHVINLSTMSTKGYDMTKLQKQITSLERENQKLEFKIAKYSSMQSIQERLNNMDMVVADNVEYVTIMGTTVARR